MNHPATKAITRIVLPYVLFAGLWILLSDRLLEALVPNSAERMLWSIYKGWAFVLVTALLLASLLRWEWRARQQAVEALREKEHLLSESQRIGHIGSWLFELQDRILWSEEMYRLYGVSPETFTPTVESFLSLIHPDDRSAMRTWIAACAAGKKTGELEVRVKRSDGTVRLIRGRGELMYDAGHKPTYMAGTAQDITKHKQAEEEIAEANAELRATNRIVSAITGVLHLQEILDFVLNEALGIVGLEGGTICLVTPDETLKLAAQAATSEATVRDLTTNQIKVGECLCGECARTRCPLILRNRAEVLKYSTRESTRGENIHFHAAYPLVIATKCVGVLCVFTRTDKKPPERRLKLLETVTGQVALAIQNALLYEEVQRHTRELEQRVAKRTAELAVAKERAEESDRLKSAFLATMSHELRTPLNSIIGFTGIILQGLAGPLNVEQARQLGMVQSSARHLLALINDVLDISKIEAGQLEIHPERFDLPAALEKAAALVKPLVDKKGLALRVVLSPNVGPVVSDRLRVEQVLLNLLNNAVKFTERGEVRLTAETGPDTLRISVADTGIGIKSEDMEKLFQPFRQIDSGLTRQYEGTGLGLAICRRLADRLGGEISARSTWGEGSVFTFMLPLKHGSQP
jgi:PAS domain S-box-containing protein